MNPRFFGFLSLLVLFSGCSIANNLAGSYLTEGGIELTSKTLKVASLVEDTKDLFERRKERKKRQEEEQEAMLLQEENEVL